MVSTRSHPREFPPPTTPRTPRASTRSLSPSNHPPATTSTIVAGIFTPTSFSPSAPTTTGPTAWQHTPSNLTILWLAISLPLVIWDTGYVLLRPYTMPGGSLHYPLWAPYELYGRVDHYYGWPAWNARDGFTGAQGWLNAVETLGYAAYLWAVWQYGVAVDKKGVREGKGRGAPSEDGVFGGLLGKLTRARRVGGRVGALATLGGFAISVMTLSKTVLYWLVVACAGFQHIKHNDFWSLLFLWIIPNGLWLIFPSYMVYVFGREIVQGLEMSGIDSMKKGR